MADNKMRLLPAVNINLIILVTTRLTKRSKKNDMILRHPDNKSCNMSLKERMLQVRTTQQMCKRMNRTIATFMGMRRLATFDISIEALWIWAISGMGMEYSLRSWMPDPTGSLSNERLIMIYIDLLSKYSNIQIIE